MKKLIFLLGGAFAIIFGAKDAAYAQMSANTQTQHSPQFSSQKETAINSGDKNTFVSEMISPKALKTFAGRYKNQAGEYWEVMKDGFSAHFNSDGISNRIYFDRKGRWVGSMKGYQEDKMPRGLRTQVKRTYFDYKINYVQELETYESEGKPTFIVNLEDDDNIILLRIYEGELEVWRSYKKRP